MKKILATGSIVLCLIAVIILFMESVVNLFTRLLRPLILSWLGKDFLTTPLTILFLFSLIFLLGFFATREKIPSFLARIWIRLPGDIEKMPGALVATKLGVYLVGVVRKQLELRKSGGETQKLYVIFVPTPPFPGAAISSLSPKIRLFLLEQTSRKSAKSLLLSAAQRLA